MNKFKIIEKKFAGKYKNWKEAPKGGSSIYIQLTDKMGVKIDHYSEYYSRENAIEAGRSLIYEYRTLKKARKRLSIVPKTFGIKVFKIKNGKFVLGILMEHLGKTRLCDISTYRQEHIDKMQDIFRKAKMYHSDIHSENIMIHKGKMRPIDFQSVELYENITY